MKTYTQYILGKIAEEASELAQQANKASDYGMDEVQPGQSLNNAQRLLGEFFDLCHAMQKLEQLGLIEVTEGAFDAHCKEREPRFQKFLQLSRSLGQTEPAA